MLYWIRGLWTRPALFPEGTRVSIVGHGGWPDGSTGTIRPFPGFVREHLIGHGGVRRDFLEAGLVRITRGRRGKIYSQWVAFDSPLDDGSGDGPYEMAEIDVTCLSAGPL